MISKTIGSVLMILGTAVGAGMLALPIASAHANWQTTTLMMLFSWFFMTTGAFAILEVNLWFSAETNLISMVDKTLGKYFKYLTWFVYLLLLYSLLCAYLSGGSDILRGLFSNIHVQLPSWGSTLLALVVLGAVVIRGVGSVDMVNRGLMSVKLLAYAVLVIAIFPHVSFDNIHAGDYVYSTSTLMVMMTSFGFAIIVPTLRGYLNSDVSRLKKVLFIGSLLPLILYLVWIFAIQGLLSRAELLPMISGDTNSLLMNSVSELLNKGALGDIAKLFISICAITSFLGVSICLVDFLADGLQWKRGIKIYAAAFLPPLSIVLINPNIFIKALSYAGLCCVYLLILLPMLMLYSGRYRKHIEGARMLPKCKYFVLTCILIGIMLMVLNA
ncbi:MAG: aromatic amino acid transport family protein [Gammaproteobacteria bacterium]|nr:aromatic amino acid transport family protein [Gammaproteobacteria bacterium]